MSLEPTPEVDQIERQRADRCGFIWQAPFLLPPPSIRVISVEQKCILERGHTRDHRSLSKVTVRSR